MKAGIFSFFESISYRTLGLLCFFTVLLTGAGDHFMGSEASSAILYLAPILTATWFGDRKLGIGIALFSALAWAFSDVSSGRHYSRQWILVWNAGARLGIFLILSHLASQVRQKLLAEEQAAHTDVLTNTCNSRAFYEKIEEEIERCRRFHHPLTIAYIDVDNFKMVNDSHGHATGDMLLRAAAEVMRENTRHVDVVARIGGDEFAMLLTETDYDNAGKAMAKIRNALLAQMTTLAMPVTFSVGMITYQDSPLDAHAMLRSADNLMYEVKKSGKNAIKHLAGHEMPTGVDPEER
ncbi:MAG: GGDEF domain-containing protein [Proteobacteria bacterium]|nr:GGDEF domain-containing protein [Pseudomonadota bacterium]